MVSSPARGSCPPKPQLCGTAAGRAGGSGPDLPCGLDSVTMPLALGPVSCSVSRTQGSTCCPSLEGREVDPSEGCPQAPLTPPLSCALSPGDAGEAAVPLVCDAGTASQAPVSAPGTHNHPMWPHSPSSGTPAAAKAGPRSPAVLEVQAEWGSENTRAWGPKGLTMGPGTLPGPWDIDRVLPRPAGPPPQTPLLSSGHLQSP